MLLRREPGYPRLWPETRDASPTWTGPECHHVSVRLLVMIAMAIEGEAILGPEFKARRVGPYELCSADLFELDVSVVVGAVGPAAAAAATASVLAADGPFDLTLSTGIAGGFSDRGVSIGDLIVATEVFPADLGIKHAGGFFDAVELEWISGSLETASWFTEASKGAGAVPGLVLTTAGVEADVEALSRRHPSALGVAMEGAAVAIAAQRWGTPFAELRAVSDMAGQLMETLDLPTSLEQLSSGFRAVMEELGEKVERSRSLEP